MTWAFRFLLCLSLLLAAAQGNILNANDVQTCIDLCASCDGTASFENGICKCTVRQDDTNALNCVKRWKRELEDLKMESASYGTETAERSARCSMLGSRRRITSEDVERVASYFMNGGPITGAPLLDKPDSECATSSEDPITGAINLSNAKPRAEHSEVEKKVDAPTPESPVAAAPNCVSSSLEQQPIVSSSWIPNYGTGWAPITGAPQPYQTGFYPHMLGAIPHMVMAIPNAVMRAASQVPSHHSEILGASHHSPILASLASGTHNVLQRLDKMVSSHSENKNKVVGAPKHAASNCKPSSHSSLPKSNIVGAPAARTSDSSDITPSMLKKVLAHQNSLLEALSHQLGSLSPQVGAPRVLYPSHSLLGAPYPMGQYVQQPMNHFCPDVSSTVGSPKAAETPEKSLESLPTEAKKVADPKDAENQEVSENKDAPKNKIEITPEKKADVVEEKEIEETKNAEEEESEKAKRETRSRFTNRKKRGDVKYAKKRETQSSSD